MSLNGASIQARGRVPIVAGAGSTLPREAVELAQHAENAGADAVLVCLALLQQADAGRAL